jgi:hypothetical protein
LCPVSALRTTGLISCIDTGDTNNYLNVLEQFLLFLQGMEVYFRKHFVLQDRAELYTVNAIIFFQSILWTLLGMDDDVTAFSNLM